jgi:hypothetical protein
VRLALSLLAYNLGNLCRRLGLPSGIENWALKSLQQRLVKLARYYLVAIGGEPPDETVVWQDDQANRRAVASDRIGEVVAAGKPIRELIRREIPRLCREAAEI